EDGTFISKNLWEDDAVKPANDADTSTPGINGNLPDDEVDSFIDAYYSGNDEDILPSNVPSAISENFNSVFLDARDIDWEVSANIYKADFEINNVDYDAWYKQDGTLLAYKFDITRSSLPQEVKTAISSLYAGYTVDDAEKVVKAGNTGYFIELESRNMEEDAYFGEDGIYISDSFYQKNNIPGNGPGNNVETPNIPVDGNYTDEEIDALLLIYRQGKDRDIQASNVPAPVVSAFSTQFATVRDIEWDYVSNIYKVEFEVGNVDYEAWYVENGGMLMYTMEMRYNAIANAVQSAVLSQYPEYRVDGCDYFQKGSVKGYIIEIENKRTDAELTVVYQVDGTFISQQRD
ncbi:MAG: PepSY-like domain-containing protein, partial [Tannerella sp.]|nr:PepSY-like domain-containing protein [Tannerella sp.]